ncbi:hypothetical protein [Echinicola sp. 20G]|uniref:hypothetical protein n=1 Tax=Echinicola sp. 20G TaxID=2781961 RepID=UPI00190FC4FA|nr:hypothetical protein [Echinicola sp. 20G]
MKNLKYVAVILFACLIAFWNNLEDADANENVDYGDTSAIKREELIGFWTLGEEQAIEENGQDTASVITAFELKSDSTTVVYWGDHQVEGKWRWKAEKSIGNNNFGFSFNSDIVLLTQKYRTLSDIRAFMLDPRKEGSSLTISKGKYIKQ